MSERGDFVSFEQRRKAAEMGYASATQEGAVNPWGDEDMALAVAWERSHHAGIADLLSGHVPNVLVSFRYTNPYWTIYSGTDPVVNVLTCEDAAEAVIEVKQSISREFARSMQDAAGAEYPTDTHNEDDV